MLNPENPYIISSYESISYEYAGSIIIALSKRLTKLEININDRIAIHSPNTTELVLTLLALINCKAVAVPISTRLPDTQISDMLNSINCRFLISTTEHNFKNRINVISLADLYASAIKEVVLTKSDIPTLFDNIDFDQEATIIFTSGSSGKPKAVLNTLGNHYFSALGSNVHIPFDSRDKWMLSLPLYHVGGLAILFRAMLAGGTVVIAGNTHIEELLSKYNITHISLVSTQFIRIMSTESGRKKLKELKAVLLGGGPLPEKLIDKAMKSEINIYTSYGLTEMSSQVATTYLHDSKYNNSTKILKFRQLKIAGDGEILLRGKTLFKGYIDKGKLISSLDSEGWFHTSDIGELDEHGGLIVKGRKDNMFISGGENIHPEEIEKCLSEIEGISQAIVVPAGDPKFGKRPVAYINLTAKLDESKIQQTLAIKLPKFKIPDRFMPFPENYKQKGMKSDRIYLTKYANRK